MPVEKNHELNQVEIPLLVVGCNYRQAPSVLRQALVSSSESRQLLYQSMRKIDPQAGLLVLETCNRVEWIISSETPDWIADIMGAMMVDRWKHALQDPAILPQPQIFVHRQAALHVLQVVLGMESLATGEAQIAGQFQLALNRAITERTSSPVLNRLGHIAGRIAKKGYKLGFRSNYRQGIHGLVGTYLRQTIGLDQVGQPIVVAGMGAIGRRTAALLEEHGYQVIRVNRTIAPEHCNSFRPLGQMPSLTQSAAAVVIATGSPTPIFHLQQLLSNSSRDPLPVLDIGIPLQVCPDARQDNRLIYRTMDDLLHLEDHTALGSYYQELQQLIQNEFDRFAQYTRSRNMNQLLDKIRQNRLDLTKKSIPDFVGREFPDFDQKRQKEISASITKLITHYSNDIFSAFHDTLNQYWSHHENQK
jgi:glutamyl-tRNA reductase